MNKMYKYAFQASYSCYGFSNLSIGQKLCCILGIYKLDQHFVLSYLTFLDCFGLYMKIFLNFLSEKLQSLTDLLCYKTTNLIAFRNKKIKSAPVERTPPVCNYK